MILAFHVLIQFVYFEVLKFQKKSGELEEEESESTDLLKVTLFHNESFLKLISPEWLVSTFKKAFSPLIQHEPSKFQIIPFESNDDVLSDKNLDILAKNNNLSEDASEEIVFPFFDIKKPKEKKKKRQRSSLEIHKNQKQNDDVIDTLSRHLNGSKITRVNLIALSDHLIETNKTLPQIKKSASKKDIIDWYRLNWKMISPCLGAFGCLAPDGSEVSENEYDILFLEEEDY